MAQYDSLSWLGGFGAAGECVSHKHWQQREHGDRGRHISYTGSSTVTLLKKSEQYHTQWQRS